MQPPHIIWFWNPALLGAPPPQALQMSQRRSLSPDRVGLAESVICAMQVHMQDGKE